MEIDTTDRDFKPGKKLYERVKKCVERMPNLIMDYIVTWVPNGKALIQYGAGNKNGKIQNFRDTCSLFPSAKLQGRFATFNVMPNIRKL